MQDVERLLKGRPMEHLSFLQWLRGFFDQHDRGIRYDALSRRGSRPINGYLGSAGARRAPLRAGQGAGAGRGASTPRWAGEISRGASRAPASPVPDTPGAPRCPRPRPRPRPRPLRRVSRVRRVQFAPALLPGAAAAAQRSGSCGDAARNLAAGLHSESPRAGRQGAGGGGGTAVPFGKERGGSNTLAPQDPPRAGAGAGAGAEGPPASPTTLSALFGEDARLRAERNALQAAVAELVAERDYYYARLRGVEEACQRREDEAAPGGAEAALLEELVGIMYAPDGGGPEARLAPPEPAQAGAAPQTGSEPGACRGDVAAWEEASGRDGGRAASGREAASPSLDSFP